MNSTVINKKCKVTRSLLTIWMVTQTIARCEALSMTSPQTTTSSSSISTATSHPHHFPHLSLGGPSLRHLVRDAAFHDAAVDDGDVRGVLWTEHLNLVVGCTDQARFFYQDVLGLSRDLGRSFHVNLGQQQFHLAAVDGEPAQSVAGSVGLVVPSLDTVRERLKRVLDNNDSNSDNHILRGTLFGIVKDDENERVLTLRCPWGNLFHLYGVDDDDKLNNNGDASSSSRKMVNLHAPGGAYGPHRMAVRGQPGIRYVELACPPGKTEAVARFYREMLGCTVSLTTHPDQSTTPCAVVCVGPGVHLVFVEQLSSSSSAVYQQTLERMQGVHVCIYAADFRGIYQRLEERGLIWTNPRFVHLDTCPTWSDAMASHTLRFRDIVDLDTGDKIMELEHETRPLRHGQYLKVPFYEPK